MFFTLGLVPISVNMVLTRAFYALEDVKTPVKIGALIIVIDILLSCILFKLMPYGGAGLAFANSLALLVGTIGMYFYLKRKMLPDLKEGNLLISLIKMSIMIWRNMQEKSAHLSKDAAQQLCQQICWPSA